MKNDALIIQVFLIKKKKDEHYIVKAESSMASREQSTKPIMKLRLDGSLIMTLTKDESNKSITFEGLKLFAAQ